MPLFGKPSGEQPRKPFNLSQQNGEQVDSVRSKIASLIDGATEKRAPEPTTQGESTEEFIEDSHQPKPAAHTPSLNSREEEHRQETAEKPIHTQPQPSHEEMRDNAHTNPAANTNRWWDEDQAGENQAFGLNVTNGADSPQSEFPSRGLADQSTTDIDEPTRERPTYPRFAQNEVDTSQSNHEWPRRSDWQSSPPVEDTRGSERTWPSQQSEQTNWPSREEENSSTRPPFTHNSQAPVSDFAANSASDNEGPAPNRPFVAEELGGTALPPTDLPQAGSQTQPGSTAQQGQAQAASAINIKGRAGGILVEIGHGDWSLLMASLAERLAGAGNFFRNGAVALDLAARPLTETELHQLHKMLTDQELELVLVNTASQETFQVALDMGLSAKLETLDGETTASAQPAHSNLRNEPHFVYAGHLRAGQVLQRSEHVLVIGDVNPGATVISNGDILVWGNLRGLAHAGAGGDTRAVIAALHLTPVQLRISDFVAIAPEPAPKRRWGRQQMPSKQAEVAYIHGDRIIVEPWDATKFGGIAALRQ